MSCGCWTGLKRWRKGLDEITQDTNIAGIERIFDIFIYCLRVLSISEWASFCVTGAREGDADQKRDLIIVDCYVIAKTVFVLILALVNLPEGNLSHIALVFTWYLLAEMYVSLLNVVFVGTMRNERPISIARSLLLLILNAVQIVLSFALFYRMAVPLDMDMGRAIITSAQVFGTIGFPNEAPKLGTLQIALDFVFLAIVLAKFIGQAGKRASG